MDGEDDNLMQGGTHEEDFGDMDMEPMNEVVEPADDLPPADGETEDGMLEPPQEIDVPNNDVAGDGEPNVEPMEVQPDEAPYDEEPDMPMDEQPAEYEAQAHEQPAYIFHEEPAGDAVEQPEEVMEEPPADQDYYQPEEDRMDDGQPIDADAYYSADVHVDAMHEEAQPEDEYAHHEPSDELMEMPVGEPLEEPVDEVDVEQPQPEEVYDEPRQLNDEEAQQPEEADDQLPVEQHEQPHEIYEEQPAEMEYEQPNTAHPADETDEQSNEIYDEQPAAVEIVDEQPAEAVVAPAVDEEPTADPEEEAAPSGPVDASADVAAGSAGEDEHPEQVQLENPQEEDEAVQEPAPEEQEAEGAAVVEEGEEQPTTTEDAQDAAGSMEMVDESDRGPVSEQPESVGDQLTISEGAPYEEAGALAATIQGPSDEQVVAPTEVPPQSERATVPLETETVAEDAAEEQPATADAEEAPAADDAPATTAEDPASVAPHTEAEGATEKVPSPPRSARPRSRSPKGTRRTASPDRIAVSSEVPTYQRSPPRTVAMAGGSMVRVQQPQDAAAEEAEQRMVMGGDDSPDWYVQFRRGYDNSHVNRMMEGSYSRFLLSTDNVPDTNLMGSFYGSVAMTGTMPIHAALARAPQRPMNEIQYSPRRVASRGGVRSSSEAGRPYRTAHNMGGTMSSTLRREQELMDGPEYTELCGQRERRRRDPRHCREVPGPGDYVYYNHKSKGFYIPQDAPPDTLMLNYNHLYDFGDGSRFLTPGEPARRNPGAAPPKSYAETRGAARWRATSGRRAGSANQGGVQFREDPAVQRREEIRKGASSLRVAKAVDVQKLHCSQFRKTRTIEEVIAEDNHYVDESAVGIEHVVHTGKLNWSDMPANLRTVVTNNTAASDRQYSPNRGGMPAVSGAGTAQQRQGGARLAGIQRPNSQSGSAMTFTDRPGPGVLDVVGNTRDGSFQQARMNTTASSNGGQSFDRCPPLVHPAKPAEPQHAQPEPPVSLPSAGKPYEMSRLHFIKRHHPQTTPSAYV